MQISNDLNSNGRKATQLLPTVRNELNHKLWGGVGEDTACAKSTLHWESYSIRNPESPLLVIEANWGKGGLGSHSCRATELRGMGSRVQKLTGDPPLSCDSIMRTRVVQAYLCTMIDRGTTRTQPPRAREQ